MKFCALLQRTRLACTFAPREVILTFFELALELGETFYYVFCVKQK